MTCFKNWVCLCVLCFSSLYAIDRYPWMERVLELEARTTQEYTHSSTIDGKEGTFDKRLYNNVTTLAALVTPWATINTEFDLSFNQTQKYDFNLDAFTIAARRQWMNDRVDDLVTVTTAAALCIPYWGHLRDLSSQHHGKFEVELSCSVGRELAVSQERYWPLWAAFYCGQSLEGRPWLGGELHCGFVCHQTHRVDLFAAAERGLGTDRLKESTHFLSWSHMHYEWVDLGMRYTYDNDRLWSAYAALASRVVAHLCPKNVLSIEAGLVIPFGL